jgi:hypothetical protein
MANIGARRPASPRVPGEFTRSRGVHFPTETTSSAVAQPVPPTFANAQQTVVGFETVSLNFTVAALSTGQAASIVADAPAYFKTQGSVKLSPTDTGKIVLTQTPTPAVPNAVISGPSTTLSARGGSIAADGTLSPGTAYTQIAVNGSMKVYAVGPVAAQKVTVPVTAQLVGSSVT